MVEVADVRVRAARGSDSGSMAALQVASWRTSFAPCLPAGALDGLDEAQVQRGWYEAVTAPPSGLHQVFAALEGERVVGFAAAGPAVDDDLAPEAVGELYAVVIDPARTRRGHGSRLLAAAVEHLRSSSFRTAVTWLLAADAVGTDFLASTGWGPDGRRRELDMGEPVPQVRLHTDLTTD